MTGHPKLALLKDETPDGVRRALRAALEIAEEVPMVGCCILLFDADAKCWQVREINPRRRLETLGTLQIIARDLAAEVAT